jgi:ABC-type phosphate/phosphonate transport system substrate-binding protein
MKVTRAIFAGLLLGSFALSAPAEDRRTSNSPPIRIAVAETFFRDIPEPLVRPLIEPFRLLMIAQTGMDGDVILPKDAPHLAQDLADNKIQIALLHGFEYAWAKRQHPQLRPLMLAVQQPSQLQVFLMVRADGPLHSFADLHGKSLAMPCFCQEHCWIFMERACESAGQADPKKFFSALTNPGDVEEGLDEVVDGKVQAVIVDNVAWNSYQKRKPARAAKLNCIQKSEIFPPAVIAYREGAFDDATIKRFQESLIDGQKSSLGRQLLTLWKFSGLERAPADFDDSIQKILKAYPPPDHPRPPIEKPALAQTANRGKRP